MRKTCTMCNINKDMSEFYKRNDRKNGYTSRCKECTNKRHADWCERNPDKIRIHQIKRNRKRGYIPMSENKKCPSFLGIAVAERLVWHLFKDIVRMPNNNPGYDFICAKDKKIDVKSACIQLSHKKYPIWSFQIKNNQITDFFLLLAFNNRDDLEPLHQWLIPGDVLNQFTCTSISPSKIDKWDEYRQPIDQAQICCNILKGGIVEDTE